MSSKLRRRSSTRSSSSSSSPSTPPLTLEQDLSKAAAWHSDDDSPPSPSPVPSPWKGKGREIDHDQESSDIEIGYPPSAVEDAESRRVMSHLKNWDSRERHKRKLTRDTTIAKQAPSVVDDVGRRASTLWKNIGGRPKTKRPSGSDHQVLQGDEGEYDDGEVQLSTFESGTVDSPEETPTPTPTQTHKELPNEEHKTNPFEDPESASLTGTEPRQEGILPEHGVIMHPIPTPSLPDQEVHHLNSFNTISSPIHIQNSQPGPPQPLSLPLPKSPPPLLPPSDSSASMEPDQSGGEEPGNGRWWTEWLCGCSEGQDRGGDNQAAKTNPFE